MTLEHPLLLGSHEGLFELLLLLDEVFGALGNRCFGGKRASSLLLVAELVPQRLTFRLQLAHSLLRCGQLGLVSVNNGFGALRLVIRPSRNPTMVAPTMNMAISVTA